MKWQPTDAAYFDKSRLTRSLPQAVVVAVVVVVVGFFFQIHAFTV